MIKSLAGARWNERTEEVKDELKALLPTLTPSEVRRFYLPFHEAVIDELEENGYKESANFLRALFELDEKSREEAAGPDTLIWKKPRLKSNKDAVTRLKEGLIASKNFEEIGDSTSATVELLKMTQYFRSMTWWYVAAEQLFRSALAKAELIEDDKRTITLARYLYGRFLLEQMQDIAKSIEYLEVAREATQERSWNASIVTAREEGTIYHECNVLLYKALLMHACQLDPNQPDVIVQTYNEALVRAKDSGDYEYITNALYELGMSQLRAYDMKIAFRNFSRLLAMAKRIPDPEGICNAHKGMALAYKELKDEVNTNKHLRLIIENAAESGLTKKLAQANYFAGEHFLSERKPDIATSHLETSLNLYSKLGLNVDANKARIMAGVSKGQEIIAHYTDLIFQCATTDSSAISLLCAWKNNRSTFWTEEKSHSEESDIKSEYIKTTSSSLL